MKNIFLLFKKKSDFENCYKCKHFSKNPENVRFKKIFKIFYIKYWRFILYKYNPKSLNEEGVCKITTLGPDGQINIITRGIEKCLFNDVKNEIRNIKDDQKQEIKIKKDNRNVNRK